MENGRKRWFKIGLFAVVVLAALSLIYYTLDRPYDGPLDYKAHSGLTADRTVATSKGSITVGDSAYIDGRNLDAGLTIMNVTVWDNGPRTRRVCSVQHGTKVRVIEQKWVSSESRHYFKISGGSCMGWLAETFLSPGYYPAQGDRIIRKW